MKGSKAIRTGYLKSIQIGLLVLAVAATGFGGWAVAQDEDKLSKFLLIKLSREQSRVLCTAPAFTSCMGFSEEVCLEVSEKALQQCLVITKFCQLQGTNLYRRLERYPATSHCTPGPFVTP